LKKYEFAAFIITIMTLSACFLGAANAQTYTPGVTDGNSFKYQYEIIAKVNSSQQVTVPTPFDALVEQAKTIDWIQMTVTAVSGSTVTAEMLTRYKAGTQQPYTGTVDVATGEGQLSQFLIAANLTANSPLHAGSSEKINGTTTRTYTSGTRELNYQTIVSQYTIQPEDLSRYNITVPLQQVNTQQAYWDKITGALAELSYGMVSTSTQVNATLTLNLKLIESNVFAVPEYPTVIAVLLLLTIPAVVAVKYRKKLSNNPF
jgi:hypothetical protein